MEPKVFVDMLMTLVNAQKFSESQRYEIIGRFNSAMLNGTVNTNTSEQPLVRDKVEPKGNIIIPKGSECMCESCKAKPYKVVSDVYDEMATEDFSKCFRPELPKDTQIWADPYGNVAINCPTCRSNFSVWIKGKGEPYDAIPENEEQPLGNRLPGDANIWKE